MEMVIANYIRLRGFPKLGDLSGHKKDCNILGFILGSPSFRVWVRKPRPKGFHGSTAHVAPPNNAPHDSHTTPTC